MSTKVSILGQWQDASGNPIANGNLILRLNCDAQAGDVQIVSEDESITLDENGNIPSGAVFLYPNAELSAGVPTFYVCTVYSVNGQPVWGPNPCTVANTTPSALVETVINY